MAGERQEIETSWRDVSPVAVIAIAAMTATLSLHAWNARHDEDAWERLFEAAWGIDATVSIVLLLVAAPLAALVIVRRYGGDTTGGVLVGAGSTAAIAGVGMLVTHLLARPGGVGQLVIPGGTVAFVAAVTAVGSLLVTLVFHRPPGPRACVATWGLVFGGLALVMTAAFSDNAARPTSALASSALLIAIVVVGVANRPGRLEWVGIAALVIAIVASRWILDDSVACEDDDCLPLPMSAAWLSVAAVWLGAKWWRRDSRRRDRAAAS